MFHRSSPRSRFAWIATAVLTLMVLSAGTVAADTSPTPSGTFTQNGISADAFGRSCTSNGDDTTTCSEVGLSVFAGKMTDSFSGERHRNQVCAYLNSSTIDDVTGDLVGEPVFESGCEVDLPNGTVRVGKNLTGVTLATTTLDVQQYVCDEFTCEPVSGREVSVVGTWTGVGTTYSSKYRSSSDDGTCRSSDAGKGSSRQASFVGTVDGSGLGSEVYASITNGRFTYRSRCSEV
jgi:hypothetical protein